MKKQLLIFLISTTILQINSIAQEHNNLDYKTDLQNKIHRYAKTEIKADLSILCDDDLKALEKIIDASKVIDQIFLDQLWDKNNAMYQKLKQDTSELGKLKLQYFKINMGPWSALDNNEAFMENVPKVKPLGANYYPNIDKKEIEDWINSLDENEKNEATSFFSVIRTDPNGDLFSIGYNIEYKNQLTLASQLLKEAALFTKNITLKNYLNLRADAFLSNNYYDSDIAWMELDSPIDVTIGPYETYLDELFGYKAAFESFVTIRDSLESLKLQKFSDYLQDIENNLPIDDKYKNPKIGLMAPIRVVNVVFTSGDANRGIQAAAFNLPNDEKVIMQKGSKRVMLKNVQEAKFKNILLPISKICIDESQQTNISFESFFTHILAHELVHGLGPHDIIVGNKKTNVRKELKEYYSAIEEAKADITGLFALNYLSKNNIIDKKIAQDMYVTFLASIFRSIRFGVHEAHGKGVLMIFNYLYEQNAITCNANGKFLIVEKNIYNAVENFTRLLLTIEAEGSYIKAKDLIEKYGTIRAEMQNSISKLNNIPVDIEPIYTMVKKNNNDVR